MTDPYDKVFDDYLNHVMQAKQPKQQNTKPNDFVDVNYNRFQTNQVLNSRPSPTTCTIKPGATFYRPLATSGWPTSFPCVKESGITPPVSQDFEYRGETKVYKVGKDAIDFSKIDPNSPNLITLIEVKANFVGVILVNKSDILEIKNNNSNMQSTKTILRG